MADGKGTVLRVRVRPSRGLSRLGRTAVRQVVLVAVRTYLADLAGEHGYPRYLARKSSFCVGVFPSPAARIFPSGCTRSAAAPCWAPAAPDQDVAVGLQHCVVHDRAAHDGGRDAGGAEAGVQGPRSADRQQAAAVDRFLSYVRSCRDQDAWI